MKTTATSALAIGATGTNAGLVVPALVRRGVRVRALVRDAKKGEIAKRAGASEVAIGDLRDVRSLRAAAEGMDGLFHIGPGFIPDEAEIGYAVVEVAQRAGIKKFVYSAVMHPQLGGLLNHQVKLRVEDRLIHSGLDFTILQPAVFMQNIRRAWKGIEERGVYAEPWSPTKSSAYVDYADVAEAAALAMTDARFTNATLELCSEGMWSREQIAGLLSETLGRTIHAEATPIADALEALPPDPYLREGMRRMWEHYNRFGFTGGGNALILRTVLGREPTTWKKFLEREVRARG